MCLGVGQPVSVSKEIPRWIELDTAEIAKIGLEEWRKRLNRREWSAWFYRDWVVLEATMEPAASYEESLLNNFGSRVLSGCQH
jgi:hypothetical protein